MKLKSFVSVFCENTIFYVYDLGTSKVVGKYSTKQAIESEYADYKVVEVKQLQIGMNVVVKEDKPFEIHHSEAEQELNLYNNLLDLT